MKIRLAKKILKCTERYPKHKIEKAKTIMRRSEHRQLKPRRLGKKS